MLLGIFLWNSQSIKLLLIKNRLDQNVHFNIFTAGCVIIELFTDGTAHPFSFSQLLAYRAGEYEPKKVLDKIDDDEIKVSILSKFLNSKRDHRKQIGILFHLCWMKIYLELHLIKVFFAGIELT